jgi:glutathione S-transferase
MQVAIDSSSIGDGSNDWIEPGWQWYDVSKNAAKEAATQLIRGNSKLVAFCARGAGVAGLPAASAPLADPSATPNEVLIPAVDLLLRHITHSILNCAGKKDWKPIIQRNLVASDQIQAAIATLDESSKLALVDCLDYLRERVGVPRDMSYPAAQLLRQALVQAKSMLLAPRSQSVTAKEVMTTR